MMIMRLLHWQICVQTPQKAADELNGKARETAREVQTGALQYTQNMLEGLEYMYSTIIKEEKEYFNSVLEKLKSEHKQIVADKQEIDLQLGAGIRTGRRRGTGRRVDYRTRSKRRKQFFRGK